MAQARDYTAISAPRPTVRRLRDLRPYDSISWEEWLEELADAYENQNIDR